MGRVSRSNGGTGGITLITNNTERIRITNSGGVGIGTTDPGAILEVTGDYNTGKYLLIKNKDSANSWGSAEIFNGTRYISVSGRSENTNLFQVGPGGVSIGDSYNPPTYQQGGACGLVVQSNVGIGTTNPTAKLDVRGTLNCQYNSSIYMDVRETYANLAITGTYAGAAGGVTTYGAGGWYNTVSSAAAPNSSDVVRTAIDALFLTRDRAHMNTGASIKLLDVNTNGDYPLDIRGGDIAFYTTGGAAGFANIPLYERMRIRHNGNVGIGTNNPLAKLHVYGNTTIYQGCLNIGQGSNIGGEGILINTGWMNPSDSYEWAPVKVLIRSSPIFNVNTNGNVGIGTNYPTHRLQIDQGVGNSDNGLRITNSNYGSDQYLNISMVNAGSGNFWSYAKLQGVNTGVSASTPIVLQPDGGNVGIGTLTPVYKLQVEGGWPQAAITGSATDVGIQLVNRNVSGRSFTIASSAAGSGAGRGLFYIYDNDIGLAMTINTSLNMWIAGTLTQASDQKLKKNIIPLPSVLNTISQLNPVSYHFKTQKDEEPLNFGLIAQEVQQLLPNLVSENNGDLALSYIQLVPLLIKGMQEQQQTISDLESRLSRLEAFLSR